jgi:ferredoxin
MASRKRSGFQPSGARAIIHPDECIDCSVCEPECPVDAIKVGGDGIGLDPVRCVLAEANSTPGRTEAELPYFVPVTFIALADRRAEAEERRPVPEGAECRLPQVTL